MDQTSTVGMETTDCVGPIHQPRMRAQDCCEEGEEWEKVKKMKQMCQWGGRN